MKRSEKKLAKFSWSCLGPPHNPAGRHTCWVLLVRLVRTKTENYALMFTLIEPRNTDTHKKKHLLNVSCCMLSVILWFSVCVCSEFLKRIKSVKESKQQQEFLFTNKYLLEGNGQHGWRKNRYACAFCIFYGRILWKHIQFLMFVSMLCSYLSKLNKTHLLSSLVWLFGVQQGLDGSV